MARQPAGTPDADVTSSFADAGALAAALPRAFVATGRAESLAADWFERETEAVRSGRPPIACFPFTHAIAEALFDARRSRRLVRGLEGAESALAREAAGLAGAAATRPDPARPRISRLLVVSADGAERFYRHVSRLRQRYPTRLAALMLDCDEAALGGAVYGRGRRARALLVAHKQALVGLLDVLESAGHTLDDVTS